MYMSPKEIQSSELQMDVLDLRIFRKHSAWKTMQGSKIEAKSGT